ncbi:hypothetical protein JOC74_002550 [Bacillus capparidis]|uniref:Uncharacterized protein n=1 Tax=Bacillus capparidis TaxID=1840411 RepID=A0ABS4CWZ3_9BACI|nr:hypothetical protein [Bacillus capparidis]
MILVYLKKWWENLHGVEKNYGQGGKMYAT